MKWPKAKYGLLISVLTTGLLCTTDLQAAKPKKAVTVANVQNDATAATDTASDIDQIYYRDQPPESARGTSTNGLNGQQLVSEDHVYIAQGLKSLVILAAVIALAYLCLRLLKHFMDKGGIGGNANQLQTIARTNLDQRNCVHVVQVNKRYFLVGTNEHAISLLAELGPDDIISKQSACPPTITEVSDHG